MNTNENNENNDIITPKAPRGKRSDVTEKDMELFIHTFGSIVDM